MDKINKEELMEMMELTDEEMEKIAGGVEEGALEWCLLHHCAQYHPRKGGSGLEYAQCAANCSKLLH